MRFDRVLAGIVSGGFALFSADMNGHAIVRTECTRRPTDAAVCGGDFTERLDECRHDRFVLRQLGLDEWRHRTVVSVLSANLVRVVDELVWPRCSATRGYELERAPGRPLGLVRRDDPWRFTGDGSVLMRAVRRKLLAQLHLSDLTVFDAFVRKLGDDGGDDDDGTDEDVAVAVDDDEAAVFQSKLLSMMPLINW